MLLTACTASSSAPVRRPSRPPGPVEVAVRAALVPLETCVTTGPEQCFDGIDNNCNGLLEEGCGVTSGFVQIVAGWSEPNADIDLLVTDPAGELVRTGTVTTTGLRKERDCPKPDHPCRGQNMENVYLEAGTEARPGIYRVVIRLERTNGATLPVRVNVSARLGPRSYGFSLAMEAQGTEKLATLRW